MIVSFKVDSLAQYLEKAGEIRGQWIEGGVYFDPWFRGVRDASWELVPSVFRHKLEDDEEGIRAEFIRRGTQLVTEREPRSEWEWYVLMQHYLAPTRLLDWTSSALVGLFFALNSYEPGDTDVACDAAVWMLDPWWLNRSTIHLDSIVLADWEEARSYLPPLYVGKRLRKQFPIALDPLHIARRVAVQHSHFTVHGTVSNGLMKLARRPASRLTKIILARDAIEQMRVDLYTCGITDSAVFPDLRGLSRELTRYYTDPS